MFKLLYYTEVGLSHREVPNESAICIYISGCLNRCVHCHYPLLQREDYGDCLSSNYTNIVQLYLRMATCVCFLGEGRNTVEEHEEFLRYVTYAHANGLKVCLYSGRDTSIEDWMNIFDYIKLGSYKEASGPLSNPGTNQRLYTKSSLGYLDITSSFWL